MKTPEQEIALLKKQIVKIMAQLKDVTAAFETLKTAIADNQVASQGKLAALQKSFDDLTTSVAGGATQADLDVLLASIQAEITALKATP